MQPGAPARVVSLNAATPQYIEPCVVNQMDNRVDGSPEADFETDAENQNNPYHKTAESYEKKLNLPVVRSFRRAEAHKLHQVFDSLIRPTDTVLEIGCGTGYYTRDIVKRAAKVIALDDSATMLRIVRDRLYEPETPADIVMHIGVLDYVKEWEKFMDHSLRNAKRAVVFTCPTTGPWGQVFHLLARWEGVRIQRYHRKQFEAWLHRHYPDWHCEMSLVGLNSGWSGAMTWVGVITRKSS